MRRGGAILFLRDLYVDERIDNPLAILESVSRFRRDNSEDKEWLQQVIYNEILHDREYSNDTSIDNYLRSQPFIAELELNS